MADVYSDQYHMPTPCVGPFGDLKVLYGSITLGSALSQGDVIHFFRAQKGFTPLFGWLQGSDIDTGSETLEIDVGIPGDTTKYLNSGVITGDTISNEKITVGIKIPLQEDLMTMKPTMFGADTDIIGTITAAAAGGGTGVLTLMMFGIYRDSRVV